MNRDNILIGILFTALILASIFYTTFLFVEKDMHEQNIGFEDINFTYMQHYVKFHITPEREGMSVAAWASDNFPGTTGRTDNNSEVTFPMISTAKYNILINGNKCSYYIYPVESYYDIRC